MCSGYCLTENKSITKIKSTKQLLGLLEEDKTNGMPDIIYDNENGIPTNVICPVCPVGPGGLPPLALQV